jgi:hypothetical protein
MRPIRDLTRMVTMPFTALFVVGICWVINLMTSPQILWVKWVALGMGIATVVALARGIRTLLVLALIAWVGRELYRRHGAAMRERYDAWVARTQPGWADVARAWRDPGPVVASADGSPLRH